MFNAFEEIFAPGRKHTDDERNRLALTRVDVGDGDPGRGPIDLDSGKVTVRATDATRPDDPSAVDAPAPDATVGPAREPGAAAGAAGTADAAGPGGAAGTGGGAVGTADADGTAEAQEVDGPENPSSRRITPPG
ncbi:DUF6191 domain-containing protein [Streptomyces sp. OZ13]|uniref:DUF6191 domain-containing protein n=1 Tax=Streptomyces sp. OZ13 TaxID=3452210 RepID=UPI003F8AE8B7